MARLYPFLLLPEFVERVWGTRDLKPIYARAVEQPIGEVWLTGDQCKVANGPMQGRQLADLCREFGRELVGEGVADSGRFPLLIKFLFPREKLSVQVHPDDDGARRIGQPCGKTECWYVLKALPQAQVALGFKPGTARQDVERAIRDTRLEGLLNWVNIRDGEMIYVEAGTVHAIGPGSILVETQQNSNTTYRLYDYGRPRELHLKEGLEAMKLTTGAGKVQYAEAAQNGTQRLVASPCFVVDKFVLKETKDFSTGTPATAQCLVGITGCGVIESAASGPISFARGECVIVPASVGEFRVRPQWDVEFLRAALPTEELPPPRTSLD
jgi:mannose-6-phosphate isomerase